MNATQAYHEAYKPDKRTTSETNGIRLLQNAAIRQAIDDGRQRMTARNELTQDWVLQRLMALGGFSLDQVATISESGAVKLNSPDDCKELAYLGVNVSQSSSINAEGSSESISINSKNQVRALELLGKHIGMWGEGAASGKSGTDRETLGEKLSGFLDRIAK